ncbi:MAG: hypothetical protein JNM94_14315 [Phycisphaerae bacterium]|nr:hypothetical protein [Phycisphaerae bacterium]
MRSDELDNLTRRWSSLGAGFDVELPSAVGDLAPHGDIDLERLLLDTARYAPRSARVFIMAATWLHVFGDLVAKHRLKRLIRDELEPEHHATLGLLLDIAQQGSHPLEFQTVIKHLKPAPGQAQDVPQPLFYSARTNAKLAELARRKASPISHRWNLWCEAFEFKLDAMRPAAWMMARHPSLRTRADFRGDLRASILASLQHDARAGESELRLARMAGGSRAQVRSAIANLVMTGRIARRASSASRREITIQHAASPDFE